MKKLLALILTSQIALFAGCASTPQEEAKVNQLREQIQALESTDGEQQYAPIAVEEAREAVNELASMDPDTPEFQHQLYLAEKRIEIAKEMVSMKKAEKTIANAELRRKDALLDAERQQVRNVEDRVAKMSARAQELEQQMQDLQTQETDRGLVLTLGNLLFETGESTLQSGSKRTVGEVARFLKEYPDREIRVEGFTDDRGDESFNQQLSEARAQSVKDLLVSFGVEPSRIKTEGYGEDFPVANNDIPAGRQQNRRVEIVIGDRGGAGVAERTTTMR